jgi:phage tail-like protein
MSTGPGLSAQRLPSYLPAIYRDDLFVGQYLWAFEQVLLDLEQNIGTLARLFDPMETPPEFLPWLSSWVALTLRADLSPLQQRKFLARVVSLYRRRGTKQNLQDLLAIFTRGTPTIVESDDAGPAHHFKITLQLGPAEPEDQRRQIAIAHALIDLEKPAHTSYDLDLRFPTMQIGVTSHIGVDTLLGTIVDGGGAVAAAASPKSRLNPQSAVPSAPESPPKSKRKSIRKPTTKSARKSTRTSTRKSAGKSPRKSTRKTTSKSARTS